MQECFFIFGKTPDLSAAELRAVLNAQHHDWKTTHIGARYTMGSVPAEKLPQLQQRLGGTVKTGVMVETIPVNGNRESILRNALTFDALRSWLPAHDGRASFGWSLMTHDGSVPQRLLQKLCRHGIALKRQLREAGIRASFVNATTPELSSVAVTKEHMIDQGVELCIFLEKDTVLIGQTRTVQDFRGFSARDYGRPGRDDISGMLPPKLALMMVNLAQVPLDATLFDPFCGSGTILTEALGIGMTRLIGADISEQAVQDTKENIEWTFRQRSGEQEPDIPLYVQDAKELSTVVGTASVDAIVTEPYLGPPLRGHESSQAIQKNLALLQTLYATWIRELHRILKPSGRLVIVVPHFRIREKVFPLKLTWPGFVLDRFPESIKSTIPTTPHHARSNCTLSNRVLSNHTLSNGGLPYQRPDQHIIREIVVATKK